jgi:hypothetical protein
LCFKIFLKEFARVLVFEIITTKFVSHGTNCWLGILPYRFFFLVLAVQSWLDCTCSYFNVSNINSILVLAIKKIFNLYLWALFTTSFTYELRNELLEILEYLWTSSIVDLLVEFDLWQTGTFDQHTWVFFVNAYSLTYCTTYTIYLTLVW